MVEHFKYIGSLKSADGNDNNDIKSRIGIAKEIMDDMMPIWRDGGINKKAEHGTIIDPIVNSLVSTVLS